MCYVSWEMYVASWKPCVMSAGRCVLLDGSHVLCQLVDMSYYLEAMCQQLGRHLHQCGPVGTMVHSNECTCAYGIVYQTNMYCNCDQACLYTVDVHVESNMLPSILVQHQAV